MSVHEIYISVLHLLLVFDSKYLKTVLVLHRGVSCCGVLLKEARVLPLGHRRSIIVSLYYHKNFNPLNPKLNPICYLLALLAHHFLHVSRIRVNSPAKVALTALHTLTYTLCNDIKLQLTNISYQIGMQLLLLLLLLLCKFFSNFIHKDTVIFLS